MNEPTQIDTRTARGLANKVLDNNEDVVEILRNPWPWVQSELKRHGWSSIQIAEMTGFSSSSIRAYRNGQNTYPRYEMLKALLNLCINEYLS